MRDSPVSVSAAQTKCCVCFVPLKIFLNFGRRTIFRNIEISEYRAFGTLGRPRSSSGSSSSSSWRGFLGRHSSRQKTTRRIEYFWRCISRRSCRESIPTSREAGKDKRASQCYSIYTSQSWEFTVGSRVNIGDVSYRSRLGRGGDLLTEGSGKRTQRQNGGQEMCIPPPGAGGGMSARGFKQRCTKTINRHGTHTHTHTQENTHTKKKKSNKNKKIFIIHYFI